MSRCFAGLLAGLLTAFPVLVEAQLQVGTDNLRLWFSERGNLLEAEACLPECAPRKVHRQSFGRDVPLAAFAGLERGPVTVARSDEGDWIELRFDGPGEEDYRVWRIPRRGYRLELEAQGLDGLRLAAGRGFRPPPADGFGVWLEQPRYLLFDGGEAMVIGLDEPAEAQVTGDWTGFRNRFWSVMARPAEPSPVQFTSGEGQLDPVLRLEAPGKALSLSLYVGPVEPRALRAADPALHGMMYASLWFWLRWICIALAWLFALVYTLIPAWGPAIMALSLVVHTLMRPLSRIADRLQDQVHRTEALLGPKLRAIQAEHKGEEQSKQVLALYRAHGVHPLYSLKSLAGVAVVIPVFIGAFDMLAENIWLAGESFLWIQDLARPDAIAPLPFTIPFFGGQLNLLPFLMTALSVLASALHHHEAMDTVQRRRQRRNLTLMALGFLALFYTFPAGMVLYWTTNNLISAVKYGWQRKRSRDASSPAEETNP